MLILVHFVFRVGCFSCTGLFYQHKQKSRKIGRPSLFKGVSRICRKLTRGRMWDSKENSVDIRTLAELASYTIYGTIPKAGDVKTCFDL